MNYIGIDPGLRSGAWAVIDHHGNYIACGDIPADPKRINAKEFRQNLQEATQNRAGGEICIELVHTMPGQGIASSGAFMRAAGAIEAVCSLLPDYIVSYTTPQTWKQYHGLSFNKDQCLIMARQLFPEAEYMLRRKKDHNRAEALLIADFWRQSNK